MKELPILFKGEMVRAILDGRKTQTRRIIVPQPTILNPPIDGYYHIKWRKQKLAFDGDLIPYAPYRVGDRLYVRESWDFRPMSGECAANRIVIIGYRADGATKAVSVPEGYNPTIRPGWRPNRYMPKWAARIWLVVTAVRTERVQDISDEDITAEGIPDHGIRGGALHKEAFEALWDSINKKRGFGWDVNPHNFVYDFKEERKIR